MQSLIQYWREAWYKTQQIWQTEGGLVLIYKLIRKCKRKLVKEVSQLWQQNSKAIATKWHKKKAIDAHAIEFSQPIEFPWFDQPQISLIVYGDSQAHFTYNCLAEIASWINQTNWQIEIILIEDGNQAFNIQLSSLISGLWVLKNKQKLGIIDSFQRAITKARGKYLLLLRQDLLLSQSALERMIDTFIQQKPGVLFPKLSYPQRELFSAGGIIWRDGSLTNYGASDFNGEPEYNYQRIIDFGLPIAFLISDRSLIKLLKSPENEAHNQDYNELGAIADFCLTLKHSHSQSVPSVLYDPKVEIICQYGYTNHYVNQSLTEHDLAKWQKQLSTYPLKPQINLRVKANNNNTGIIVKRNRPTILIIDTLVPAYDKESGALRLFQIIRILLDLEYDLIFLPDQGHDQAPYTSVLEDLGIEVLYFSYKQTDWRDRLIRRLELIDIAWVCRPELCEKYLPILGLRPQIKLIYDTIDLHFLRLKRAWELDHNQAPSQETSPQRSQKSSLQPSNHHSEKVLEWQKMQQLEFSLAQNADVTVVVTEVEKQILDRGAARQVRVIPNIHQIYSQPIPGFSDRQNLLFIGGYYHKPNVDAVLWLCNQIMPLIWQSLPQLKLTLLGSNPSAQVLKLASDRVSVPGYIPEINSFFLNHRLFVAPLRYGAGMKGKIGQSLSFGLPTITTSIGAEGMGLSDRQNVLIANSATEIAEAVIDLYQNPQLWQKLSQSSFEVIRPYTLESVKQKVKAMLTDLST